MRQLSTEIAVIGSGVAGAWAFRSLVKAGADAILLDHQPAGQAQTLAAQGILHSGVKYGLDGASRAIGELLRSQPPIWMACLRGEGEHDLRRVEVASAEQFMWAGGGWFSSVAATVGARAMRGDVKEAKMSDWPAALAGHKGKVHVIQEAVLSTRTILDALIEPVQDRTVTAEIQEFFREGESITGARIRLPDGEELLLSAKRWIFTAGEGNAALAELAGVREEIAQIRPLVMGMLRGPLPPLFGHAVAASPVPRLTVSSHQVGSDTVWYLGGEVAEKGPGMSRGELRDETAKLVREMFPRVDFSGVRWAPWAVNRAEPKQAGGKRPDGPALANFGNVAIGWPTKMVYAPALAALILESTGPWNSTAERDDSNLNLPPVRPGRYPWELADDWEPLTGNPFPV